MAYPEPALAEASIAASIAEIERLIAVKCFSEPNGAQRNPPDLVGPHQYSLSLGTMQHIDLWPLHLSCRLLWYLRIYPTWSQFLCTIRRINPWHLHLPCCL